MVEDRRSYSVMPGEGPASTSLAGQAKTWMAGPSHAMTRRSRLFGCAKYWEPVSCPV
jgi:hypothetical protein